MMIDDTILSKYIGGGVSTALLNTIFRFINFTLDFGKTVGSVIRRGRTKNYC